MEASSSSKVTVEYHDPSGVFPLVSHDIAARLPLRNLNWQSQNRPLRQIKSLHVDFVPDEDTRNILSSNGATSIDLEPSKQAAAGKQRRHQIPGLKTSPYLKIYVLRCDDKDAYKASERKKLREWMKENVQPESKREKHDALEWMILHVVLPDTIASSEPRWRESTRDPDELKERSKSNLKLPGKSTRTVFDKLRADFNESSKTGPDRIAQIRLLKNQVPPDLLPTPAIAQTLNESPQERENAWADIVTKFKTLILIPLDARVRQYEEDIAEQESRRSLPGWNFCTFFIHKEGLAKALESVGLVEDALVIYDELNLGLETVIRDLASGNAEGTLTSFEPTSKDVTQRITSSAGTAANGTLGSKHLTLFDKDYREDIVRSQISIFDFFCYLFSRQKALILRLAGAELARTEFGTNFKEGGEDLVLLAEVCWRTLSFVHNSGRTLRQDLSNGSQNAQHSLYDIEALISSWTYSVAGQVLDETETVLLDPSAERPTSAGSTKSDAQAKAKRREFDFAMGGNAYPERSSSFRTQPKRPSSSAGKPLSGDPGAPQVRLQSPPAVERQRMEEGTYGPQGAAGGQEIKVPDKPGLVELSAYRAELVMIRRKMLELLAKRRGWATGWAGMKAAAAESEENSAPKHDDAMEEVGLEDESSVSESESKGETDDDEEALKSSAIATPKEPPQPPSPISDLLTPALATALASEASFYEAFEALSSAAIQHYLAATHTKSAETITGDIAMLKFQQREFATAATYFEHVLPLYTTDAWGLMEAQALEVFLQCLRELDRKSELAKRLVTYLKSVANRKLRSHGKRQDDDDLRVQGYLTQLVEISAELGEAVNFKMEEVFSNIQLSQEIGHLDDRDGFSWLMSFEHLLHDEVNVDEVKVKLVGVEDSAMEIWLSSSKPPLLKPGTVTVTLQSPSTATGAFYIDTITMKAENVTFTHETQPQPERNALGITTTGEIRDDKKFTRRPFLLPYPPIQAFFVRVELSKTTHIEKTKHLEIKLSSGWNEIESIDLRLKPKSAGLRLHVVDATVEDIELLSDERGKPVSIALGALARDVEAAVRVPYTLEQAATGISIRLEAVYRTAHGEFTFLAAVKLPTVLSLDVDVNDVFHHDALFSTFTVRTTNRCPLAISHAELVDSPIYAVEQPPVQILPATVFEGVPLALVYKIKRKSTTAQVAKHAAALALTVQYQSVDELVLRTISESFATELENSSFGHLRRLLMPLLQERAKQRLSSKEIDLAVFTGEAKVPSFADLCWFEVVNTLPHAIQRALSDWLMKWHIDHPRVAIELDGTTAQKEIRLRVEIPNLDVVFSTAIALTDKQPGGEATGTPATVGQPIEAEMIIKYTKAWSIGSIFGKDKKAATKGSEKAFVLDIQMDPETWLVGGAKRKQFTLPISASSTEDNVALTLPLVLVPLKPGLHALPTVDVQAYTGGGEGQAAADETTTSCETHCQSAGLVMRVIREIRTTRVEIVESEDE